jgi:type I restriction enzyme S subunit
MSRDLPPGWVEAKLGELCQFDNGRAFKPNEWSTNGLPIIRIQNLNNDSANFNYCDFDVDSRYHVKTGDLLFAWSGTPGTSFGAHVWTRGDAVLNQHIFNVRFDDKNTDRDFLKFAINQQLDELIHRAQGGVGLRHVTKGVVEDTSLQLPPLPEQRRIVERIEALLAKGARAEAALLAAIPDLLDRYRRSLLAAAFRGDLSGAVECDAGDRHAETLAEVRRAAIRRSDGQGRRARRDVLPPDPEGTAPLPPGWIYLSLDQLISGIDTGKSFRCIERPPSGDEAGVLKISAVTWGVFDEEESKTAADRDRLDPAARVRPGDLLISRANTLELVGACTLVHDVRRELYLSDKILRLRSLAGLERWVMWFLRSPAGRRQLEAKSSGNQLSMRNIGQDALRSVAVPITARAEMDRVVARLEHELAGIERIRSLASAARGRHADLIRSVLAKAFRGELVPQDPSDEPASVLLERIRAERGGQPQARRRGRRPRGEAV